MLKKIQLFFLLYFVTFLSFGQQKKIDSLKSILKGDLSKKERLIVLNKLSLEYIKKDQYFQGFSTFKKNDSLAKELNDKRSETISSINISRGYQYRNDTLNAIKYGNKAVNIQYTKDDFRIHLRAINDLGTVYSHFLFYKKAIDTYKIGIEKYKEDSTTFLKKDLSVVSFLHVNLANAYDNLGDTNKAIKNLLEAAKIGEKIKSNGVIFASYTSLGAAYYNKKKYDKAEEYFLEANKISIKNTMSEYYKYGAYVGLSLTYIDSDKYDLGLQYAKKALSYYNSIGERKMKNQLLAAISKAYYKKQLNDSVFKYTKLILNSPKEKTRQIEINKARQILFNVYFNKRQISKAQNILYKLAKDTVNFKNYPIFYNKDAKLEIYNSLSKLNEAKGSIKQSLVYYKKYKALNDSIQKSILDSKYANIETKYQTEQKEKENLQLRASNAEQKLKVQQANFQKWLFVIFLLIVSTSVFFIWRRYKLEIKAKKLIRAQKQSIEHQKNLVESLQKELHHRLKNNLSFIDLFINLAKSRFPNKEYQEKLNELQNRVRSMFEVHKQLYKKDDVTEINAKNYIDILVDNVKKAYEKDNINIVNTTQQNEQLSPNTSFPIGLIVNEFVTNSFKYAFDNNEQGIIDISLWSDENNYHLSLKDNGIGLSTNFDIDNLNSFGLETIQLLTQEYKGSFFLDGSNGVEMNIHLPKLVA